MRGTIDSADVLTELLHLQYPSTGYLASLSAGLESQISKARTHTHTQPGSRPKAYLLAPVLN